MCAIQAFYFLKIKIIINSESTHMSNINKKKKKKPGMQTMETKITNVCMEIAEGEVQRDKAVGGEAVLDTGQTLSSQLARKERCVH